MDITACAPQGKCRENGILFPHRFITDYFVDALKRFLSHDGMIKIERGKLSAGLEDREGLGGVGKQLFCVGRELKGKDFPRL